MDPRTEPWYRIFKFIQLIESGNPVSVQKLSEITGIEDTDQIEGLIELILEVYPWVGIYDKNSKSFTKGINILHIEDFIKMLQNYLDTPI